MSRAHGSASRSILEGCVALTARPCETRALCQPYWQQQQQLSCSQQCGFSNGTAHGLWWRAPTFAWPKVGGLIESEFHALA